MKRYTALGVMSGSSLDGIDLALCSFTEDKNQWNYQILKAETISYSEEWKNLLSKLPSDSAQNLIEYDILYGRYLGELCFDFLNKHQLTTDLIASHGHTIFHNPDKGYTYQLGNGQALASESGVKTICDFRIKNVLWGGQGAPLVPIGDEFLFHEMDYCLNLGGIANISFREDGKRIAYDVCPANQLLNHLSMKIGLHYDKDGNMARKGKLISGLFDELNNDSYYKRTLPKSIGNEYVRDIFINLLTKYHASIEDLLHTSVKHIAFQVGQIFKEKKNQKVLVTGGGAYNNFIMEEIKNATRQEFIIPHNELVDFKEALIFAFMGVLKDSEQINCLASYTGARQDLSTGDIYLP